MMSVYNWFFPPATPAQSTSSDAATKTFEQKLYNALNVRDAERIAELLQEHPRTDITALPEKAKYSPLRFAVDQNHADSMRALLTDGVLNNAEEVEESFLYAIEVGRKEAIEEMLKANVVDLNKYNTPARCPFGIRCLHVAFHKLTPVIFRNDEQSPSLEDYRETLVTLIECNKHQLDALDEDGKTLLHYAAVCGDYAIVEKLAAAGVDPSIRDREGTLPIEQYLSLYSNRADDKLAKLLTPSKPSNEN